MLSNFKKEFYDYSKIKETLYGVSNLDNFVREIKSIRPHSISTSSCLEQDWKKLQSFWEFRPNETIIIAANMIDYCDDYGIKRRFKYILTSYAGIYWVEINGDLEQFTYSNPRFERFDFWLDPQHIKLIQIMSNHINRLHPERYYKRTTHVNPWSICHVLESIRVNFPKKDDICADSEGDAIINIKLEI